MIHAECERAMRIHRLRRANISITDEVPCARHRDFELFRIGRERREQSSLRESRFRGLGGHFDF